MDAKKSVALLYDPDLPAPFVAAKGRGHLAEKLVELARACQVPTVKSGDLANTLFYLEVGDFIPEPFYTVVAELLVFVWKNGGHGSVAGEHGKGHGN